MSAVSQVSLLRNARNSPARASIADCAWRDAGWVGESLGPRGPRRMAGHYQGGWQAVRAAAAQDSPTTVMAGTWPQREPDAAGDLIERALRTPPRESPLAI